MAYLFEPGDRSVEAALRRIALEQIDGAIKEAGDNQGDPHVTVHEVRKRCKRLRGLLRLVRPVFGDFKAENALIRDAAGELSFLRDAGVMLETFDALVAASEDRKPPADMAQLRKGLVTRREAIERSHDIHARLARFRRRMIEIQRRACRWHLDKEGFDAIAGGLGRTYKGAQKAMIQAGKRANPDAMHEWRKQSKAHLYHANLLVPIWPGPMLAHQQVADQLAELLGQHHDLQVFRLTLLDDPKAMRASADAVALIALTLHREKQLATDSFALGARLYAERTAALTSRWRAYWNAWTDESRPRKMPRTGRRTNGAGRSRVPATTS